MLYYMEERQVSKMTKAYISDEQVVKRASAAVKIELEKKKAMDIPVAVYDRKTQEIYEVKSDGSRVAVSARIKKGRYSERVKKI